MKEKNQVEDKKIITLESKKIEEQQAAKKISDATKNQNLSVDLLK